MKKYLFTFLFISSFVFAFGQNYVDGPSGLYGPQWNPATIISATGSVTVGAGGNWAFGGIVTSRPRSTTNGITFTGGGNYQDTSATQYVNGYVTQVGSTAFTFPVGDTAAAAGTQYHKLAISAPSVSTTVQTAYSVAATPNSSNLNSIGAVDPNGYWVFSSSTSATATVSLTTRDETGTFGAGAMVVVAGYRTGTSQWEPIGTAVTPTGNNQVLTSNSIDLSLYSAFTVASTQSYIIVNAKVLLQGPWNGSLMSTTLNSLGYLPSTQPYSAAPFSYAGTESTTTSFLTANPAITDWVLVELRDATTPATIVAQRAAFLRSDGVLLDTGGTATVRFNNVAAGNYYIVIRHRNHMGIRSTAAQAISSSSAQYDFTTAMTQSNGSNPVVAVSGGKYAMWAGDVSNDGKIYNTASPSDAAAIVAAVASAGGNPGSLANYTGLVGYSRYDLNMDGKVFNTASPSDKAVVVANVAGNPANSSSLANSTLLIERLP